MDPKKITPVQTIDVQELTCPMPLIHAKRALEKIKPGEVLELLCGYTDTTVNIKEWCQKCGHLLLGDIEEAKFRRLYIKKQ